MGGGLGRERYFETREINQKLKFLSEVKRLTKNAIQNHLIIIIIIIIIIVIIIIIIIII